DLGSPLLPAALLLNVEGAVLYDDGAPGVVQLRYRVVTAQKLDSPYELGGVREQCSEEFCGSDHGRRAGRGPHRLAGPEERAQSGTTERPGSRDRDGAECRARAPRGSVRST